MRSPRLPIGTRKRILKLYHKLENKYATKQELAHVISSDVGCTYFQAYAVITRRVKLDRSPRIDKGIKRKSYVRRDAYGKLSVEQRTLGQFASEYDFLRHNLMLAYEQLQDTKLSAADRIRLLKDASWIELRLQQMQLTHHLKRPDAVLITRIMRRFDPQLSDDDVIRIYREESEKLMVENKS